jgi:UDP-N-acetylmuramyl pentapeptide phosphotransferase/UDP-N-acetylglucosamine-1-phosphate transferase
VNWIDGIYAQGNGILTIGFFTIFALIQWVVLQYYTEFTNLETLLLVKELALLLALISLVYTVVEWKPLGLIRDVGTMFLAFGLAYLSVVGGTKIGTVVVALSLVIFDAIWIIWYRLFILKKSPMKGDYTHLHFRLL